MSVAPLTLPDYTALQRFLEGVPLVGARPTIDLVKQLSRRGPEWVDEWNATHLDVDLFFAFRVARLVRDAMQWPNDRFVPDDPMHLLVHDRWFAADDATFVVLAIEDDLALRDLPGSFWTTALAGTFGEMVVALQQCVARRRGSITT